MLWRAPRLLLPWRQVLDGVAYIPCGLLMGWSEYLLLFWFQQMNICTGRLTQEWCFSDAVLGL